jgi:DNA-binding NarL/FixJ family response regulator
VPAFDQRLRVVLIDDHALFRAGLRELLEEHGIEVAGDAPDVEAGLALVAAHAPDVAIVDLRLAGIAGLDAIRRIASSAPLTRVLALTSSASEGDVASAVLGGVSCCLLKDAPIETIVAGVRAAAAGDAIVSPKLASTLLDHVRANGAREDSAPADSLSEREREVLRLVARGKENEAIAQELFISPHTVKNHVSNILVKLQVTNRIQAAVRAVRDQMI